MEMSILIYPPFNIPEIHLHAGFWEVWTGAHHQQLTIHNGSDFHIRKTAYELAKLFDQRKAWYCKDEDLTPVELKQLIYEIREKDKGCMFLDGVLASKPRYT